jgi:hypothetical protein
MVWNSGALFSDVAPPAAFRANEWYFVAVSWKAGCCFRLTVNLVTVLDKDIENAWCVPPVDSSGSTDLIQAVEFRGFGTENFETKRYDISSISVTPMFMSAVDLQALYNKGKGHFRVRQGARVPDHLRLDSRLEYERRPFNYPVCTHSDHLHSFIHTYIHTYKHILSTCTDYDYDGRTLVRAVCFSGASYTLSGA